MIGDKWDELFWDGLRLESRVGGAWFLAYFCLLNNETFYTSLALLYTTGTASGGLQYWVQGVGYLPWGHTRVPMRKTPWDGSSYLLQAKRDFSPYNVLPSRKILMLSGVRFKICVYHYYPKTSCLWWQTQNSNIKHKWDLAGTSTVKN